MGLSYDIIVVLSFNEKEKYTKAKRLKSELGSLGLSCIIVEPSKEFLSFANERPKALVISDFFLGELGTILDVADKLVGRFLVWTDERSIYSCAEAMKKGALDYKLLSTASQLSNEVVQYVEESFEQNQTMTDIVYQYLAPHTAVFIRSLVEKLEVEPAIEINVPDFIEMQCIERTIREEFSNSISLIDLATWEGNLKNLTASNTTTLAFLNADLAEYELRLLSLNNCMLFGKHYKQETSFFNKLDLNKLLKELNKTKRKNIDKSSLTNFCRSLVSERKSKSTSDSAHIQQVNPTDIEILKSLRRNFGNLRLTASELGISPSVISERLA